MIKIEIRERKEGVFLKKAKTPTFILSLDLETQLFEEHILNKRFEIGRKIYHAVLEIGYHRVKELTKTKKWKENQKNIANIYSKEKDEKKRKKLCKPYFDSRKEMFEEYKCSEYSLHDVVKPMQHKFKKNLDSHTCQKIATRVWKALESILYKDGEKVYFKKYSEGLNSLESNGSGIKYKKETHTLEWNGLKIKVQQKLNTYERLAIQSNVKYCRISRKFVRKKYQYTLQLILEGTPPMKHEIGRGDCGIDIGTQTLAYTTNKETKLLELAPHVSNIEKEKRKIQRYLDRSKRQNNPNHYNEDGTVKKGKLKWNHSNRYRKARTKLKDIQRKQAEIRKQDYNKLANEIMLKADTIKVERMNFKALQKKCKKTEKNEKGRYKKKKRFGKPLANKAPSKFLKILERKLKTKGGLYVEINTDKVKASQYNHLTDEYVKKKLSERWNYFKYDGEEIKIQRDIYASFLIKNVKVDLETIDRNRCIKEFKDFIKYHNEEIERIRNANIKRIRSMGIERK